MKAEQKRIVKETWRQLVPSAEKAADLFYDRLLEIDPTTRPLFKVESLGEVRRKLLLTFAAAVREIDCLDNLAPMLEALGQRHTGYGVIARHYDSARDAMLWTLEQSLGPAWTADAAVAWSELYARIAAIMQRGATLRVQ